ncbi:uncharacterized protein (DUF1330 family) [Janthinobacterium sp. CG_23.3]|uniref:DUF1330 domain-containing protein n=1 Tax=Janthinobacterium sp. CG_23.3 TaxID=3349634 RepID=UPI0038D3900B
MTAYAIGSITIHNTDWQKEYGENMPALIQKHGGTVLTRAPAVALEGAPLLPGLVVMIAFPGAAQARAWYDDPAHAPLRQLRQRGAHFDLILVDGV